MVELVDLTRGRGTYLGLDLTEEPMKGNDLPTPIVKRPQAHEYAQLLSIFAMEHPSEFVIIGVMNV